MPTSLLTTFLLLSHPVSGAEPPAENVPPHALLVFTPEAIPAEWISTLQLTTASGACYEVRLNYSNQINFEQTTTTVLLAANWMVEQEFASSRFRIFGTRTADGQLDSTMSLVLVNHLIKGKGAMPQLRSVDGVKVESNTDDGLPKPIGPWKQKPTGPKLRDDSYVEFDISTLPAAGPAEAPWQSTWGVYFRPDDTEYDVTTSPDIDPAKPWEVLAEVLESFSHMGCRAEVIGKTRLRVYGKVLRGRYYPAIKGSVESDDLKPEQLPRVTRARS